MQASLSTCAKCGLQSTELDPHHPAGRLGDNLFEFIPVHRHCHIWIHANPKKATELGLLKNKLIP